MNKQILVVAGLAGVVGLTLGLSSASLIRSVSAQGVTSVQTSGPAQPAVAGESRSNATLGQSMVVVELVKAQRIRRVLHINGKLALNAMRLQQISSRVPGRIEKIMLFEGAAVHFGEPVALLYSPEFISAQNEFILARNTVRMLTSKATADLLEDARATLESARNRLRMLGVSELDIATLDRTGSVQQQMVIRSPISGRFIKRNVDAGGYLDTGASLGVVADLSTLWFLGNVYEADLARLRDGQGADLTLASMPGKPLRGRISFIAPTIDPQTHTATVRVDLSNKDGQLKPDMFGQADVVVDTRVLPVVPRAAVVQDGAESFVIVQRDESRFERIPVQVMPADDDAHLAVTSGIREGDRVVMEGSVLVDRSLTNPQAEKTPPHTSPLHRGAAQ